MFEREIERYNTLLREYKTTVIDKFNVEDLKEYNEILFSAHSCAIEGNTFSVDDTRALKEKGLGMIPQGKTLFEAFEILDHFNAYDFLMGQTELPLTEQLVKETHRILTQHTLTYRYKDAVPGEYTNTDMGAGDTIFGDHEELIARQRRIDPVHGVQHAEAVGRGHLNVGQHQVETALRDDPADVFGIGAALGLDSSPAAHRRRHLELQRIVVHEQWANPLN